MHDLNGMHPGSYIQNFNPSQFQIPKLQKQSSFYATVPPSSLGHSKYSILGWSDGGITAMILAAALPKSIHRMVVWGANATVTAKDIEMYDVIRDTSKWSPKMREPLEGETF